MKLVVQKKHLLLFSFYPIYISLAGIYRGERDKYLIEPGGAIFPLSFYVGLLLTAFYIYKLAVKRDRIECPAPIKRLFGGLAVVSCLLALAGAGISGSVIPLVRCLQLMSGGVGIILAVWFLRISRFDFKELCGIISIIFLVHIAFHLGWSFYEIGWQTLSRSISLRTPFGGIHQFLIYYPYIVSAVFLFALPFWRDSKWFIPIYLFVGAYLSVIMARGAVLEYYFAITIYMLFFSKRLLLSRILVVSFWLVFIILLLDDTVYLGRFSHSIVLGRREEYWFQMWENIRASTGYLFYGTLFGGTTLPAGYAFDPSRSLGGGMHNQYLDFLKYGGLILLSFYGALFISFYVSASRKVKNIVNSTGDRLAQWGLVIIILQCLISFNTNTPLRITNPAIIIWFYWTGYYVCLENTERRMEAAGPQAGVSAKVDIADAVPA